MSDEKERNTEADSQDCDQETEGHLKPNVDGTGELDQEGVAPDDRDY